ncbi:hypothetical protein CEUSTIGMA_g12631.t1 [Chlamydomonas eustigma]|uniref:OCRE domain-containing protein n=1 Tax=Chlamydomonas eustigma TaxID=1157962 RepID=A0A250XQ55_9CHLO|nr:hypothetical protein CEUSTIGMA_g12631.t1 [Chlamydomonas eustigma]|eukprot:GAX85211.1 hypothetical protein CEUSTIGMA_g12631.t1 [Chlamydomonas eustigma]
MDTDATKKRTHNSAQDDIVKRTLDEEEATKRAKKAGKLGVVPPKKKGLTLQEIEDLEGGVIKESLVNVAQAKRAAKRKQEDIRASDDTDMPADVDRFEEKKLEVEEEGGIKFMAFNLNEEREIGHFDEEGNFVEDKVSREDKDAWLDSAEVVSDKVRDLIAQRQAAEDAAAAAAARNAAPLTDRQIAQLKMDLATHMGEEECVSRAMRRLGGATGGMVLSAAAAAGGSGVQDPLMAVNMMTISGKALGKREKLRLERALKEQLSAAAGGTSEVSSGILVSGAANHTNGVRGVKVVDKELLDKFTEITDRLFAEGETEIYAATKEELVRSAIMWLPQQKVAPSLTNDNPAAVASAAAGIVNDLGSFSAGTAVVSQAVDDHAAGGGEGDDDDDMFAEEDASAAAAASSKVQNLVVVSNAHYEQSGDVGEAGDDKQGHEGKTMQLKPHGSDNVVQDEEKVRSDRSATDAEQSGNSKSREQQASVVPTTDFDSWPIKEIKRYLSENGVSVSNIVEKGDLVSRARLLEAQQVEAAAGALQQPGYVASVGEIVPEGFVFDEGSGYWLNSVSGMYYDNITGSYFDGTSWSRYDAVSGNYVPVS